MPRTRTARLGALFGVAAVLAAATACSSSDAPTRSIANFCSTYSAEKSKFLTRYASTGSAQSSPLTGLLLGIQSLGDVSVILTKLDRVAPDDIEPDVAAVLDSWKQMEGSMGNEASNALNPTGLLGAMFSGVLSSLESQGSWTRVGDYVTTNCHA